MQVKLVTSLHSYVNLNVRSHVIALQVRALLQEFGVVCINRDGVDARRLMFEHDILYDNRVSHFFPLHDLSTFPFESHRIN